MGRPPALANQFISVLMGNRATERCVLRLSGNTLDKGEFRGRAPVFDSDVDTIGIDTRTRTLMLAVSDEEMSWRMRSWTAPDLS